MLDQWDFGLPQRTLGKFPKEALQFSLLSACSSAVRCRGTSIWKETGVEVLSSLQAGHGARRWGCLSLRFVQTALPMAWDVWVSSSLMGLTKRVIYCHSCVILSSYSSNLKLLFRLIAPHLLIAIHQLPIKGRHTHSPEDPSPAETCIPS